MIETFLVEPALFDSYIAADPSLQWNEQALVRGASVQLGWWTAGDKQLYFATSDEAYAEAVAIFVRALEIAAPPGVHWKHEPMLDEHHGTIFPTAALHGIRMVFAAAATP